MNKNKKKSQKFDKKMYSATNNGFAFDYDFQKVDYPLF